MPCAVYLNPYLLVAPTEGVVDVGVPVVVDRVDVLRTVDPILVEGEVVVGAAGHLPLDGVAILEGTEVLVLAGAAGKLPDLNGLRIEAGLVHTRGKASSGCRVQGNLFPGVNVGLNTLPTPYAAPRTGTVLAELVGKPVNVDVVAEVVEILVEAVAPSGLTVPPDCPVEERHPRTLGLLRQPALGVAPRQPHA